MTVDLAYVSAFYGCTGAALRNENNLIRFDSQVYTFQVAAAHEFNDVKKTIGWSRPVACFQFRKFFQLYFMHCPGKHILVDDDVLFLNILVGPVLFQRVDDVAAVEQRKELVSIDYGEQGGQEHGYDDDRFDSDAENS